MDPTPVTFIERSDEGAQASLRRLRRRLEDDGLACRLLRGRAEPHLHLLVVEGDPELTHDEARGARVWRFEDERPTDDGRNDAAPAAGTGASARPGTGDA